MAIRIQKVKNKNIKSGFSYIALCAAENKYKKGDIYLDDAIDHALRMKFLKDYKSEGWIINGIREALDHLYGLGLAPFRGYYEELLNRKQKCQP